MKQPTIAILGAGSWGTAVAVHLANGGNRVLLWGHRAEQVQRMQSERCNPHYLSGIEFPELLHAEPDLAVCLSQATTVIIAVPSHAFASLINKLPPSLQNLAWLTKGIDPQTRKLLSDLVGDKWGKNFPLAIISGPSFAREVAQSLPTALTVAGNVEEYTESIRSLLHHHNLRAYLSEDIIGVQLCGAIKNVLAIACGLSDGMQYGANAKAALITRGLAEMTRFGIAMGAKPDTFMGLAGVGDLVLTCTDDQSRNRRFGLKLGQGMDLAKAEKEIGQVVEGKHNAAQICSLAKQHHVDMPICKMVDAILKGKISAPEAVANLLNRPPKME
jgi:glycerol-3-phosphate dehydrogenase (NAD(P)+)